MPVLVFAGGCAGGLARYGLTLALPTTAPGLPWGTLTANILGSFLLALLLGVLLRRGGETPTWVRPSLGTGFCGAFTTMSGLVVTVDQLAVDGHVATAAALLAATAVGGLLAAVVGLALGRRVVEGR